MDIKAALFLILTFLSLSNSFSQSKMKIDKLDNSRLVKVLNNAELLKETKTTELSIRIYRIDNEPGSAGFANGEVTHNLLVAVSEFDEYPIQSLFEIGPFYNPVFKKWTETDLRKAFVIEFGLFDQRKSIILAANIKELKMIKE